MRPGGTQFLWLALLTGCLRHEVQGAAPFEVTVLDVDTCAPRGAPESAGLLGVKVRVESHDMAGIPANYFYGSFVDSQGDRYLAELEGCSPVLSTPPLARGQTAEGFLNFPVKNGIRAGRITYAPNLDHTSFGRSEPARQSSVEVPLP